MTVRCTFRKHVVEKRGKVMQDCDCGAVFVGSTAAGNALVVTVMEHKVVAAISRAANSQASPE